MITARIGSLALLLFSFHAFGADQAPKVIVVVTPNPVSENESVQLRIEVEAAQSQIIFQPTFEAPDFIQVGSQPNYGGLMVTQYIAGQTISLKKSYFEFVLSPKKAGNLPIRNIKVKVGDKEYPTENFMVKVIPDSSPRAPAPMDDESESANPASPYYKGGSLSAPAGDIPARFNSDFTVHVSASKRKAYVGEPIVVEYWLYDYGDLRQMEVQKWPTFTGFWKDDLEITTRFEFDEIYLQNERMRRAFLGRYALFGINPGKIEVDKLVIRGQYVSNAMQRGFMQVQQYRTGIHGSQDLTLEILPLPTEGKPDKFSGAVGQFRLKVEADKTNLLQHTPVTFTITVQGVGNFQAIDTIRLPIPADFEVYESKTGSRGSNPIGMRRELETSKTFQVTAVPRKAGSFTIAPIDWWYFDPEEGRYRMAQSSPIEIHVGENSGGNQGTNTYASPSSSGSEVTGDDIRPPKDGGSLGNWKMWLNAGLGALALGNGFLAFLWLRRRAGGVLKEMLRDEFSQAQGELASAKSAKDNHWLALLEDAIYSTGQVLLGSNPRGLARAEFEASWREKKLSAPLFNRMALVLDRLDRLRFSGAKGSEKDERKKLQQEVAEIIKEAGRKR